MRWILAIAALFLLALCPTAQSQQPSPRAGQAISRPPKEKPAGEKQQPDNDQRGTKQMPFVINKAYPTPQANRESTHPADEQPAEPAKSWWLKDPIAELAAGASLIQAVALIVTIFVLVFTSRRQLRAYVFVDSSVLLEGMMMTQAIPARAGKPGVVLLFKNSGQTPAYQCLSWAQIAVIEPANAHTLVVPPLQLQFPTTIGAGAIISKTLWFDRRLTAAEIADVGIGTKLIFVYGRIEYRDTFRRKRWANFRLQYAGVFPPRPNVPFNFSERGNDSN